MARKSWAGGARFQAGAKKSNFVPWQHKRKSFDLMSQTNQCMAQFDGYSFYTRCQRECTLRLQQVLKSTGH
jgi:hypothetical protein